jgi:hypothetical protein
MRSALVAASLAALLGAALPASAQIQTLPETSRAQGQANSINESLAVQGQNRGIVQQNQFEVNSLRNQNSMQPIAPPPVVVAPGTVPARR